MVKVPNRRVKIHIRSELRTWLLVPGSQMLLADWPAKNTYVLDSSMVIDWTAARKIDQKMANPAAARSASF